MTTATPAFIHVPAARRLLREAMETQGPDFVYNPSRIGGCFYQKAEVGKTDSRGGSEVLLGDPRTLTPCLIGVALDLAGHTFHHDPNVKKTLENLAMIIRVDGQEWISEAAAQYWHQAQARQDVGASWGEAVESAEQFLATVYPELVTGEAK